MVAAAVLFSAGKNTGSHPWPWCIVYRRWGRWGGRSTGEAHAFIIKVSWDALQHLEVLKRALLREYVGIAHTRKLASLPADDGGGWGGGRREGKGWNWIGDWMKT